MSHAAIAPDAPRQHPSPKLVGIWLVIASVAVVMGGFVAGSALDAIADPRATYVSLEAWSLTFLLMFAVPVAYVRLRVSIRKAIYVLLLTIVASFAIDGALCVYLGYLSVRDQGAGIVDFTPAFITVFIYFGGPFKVLGAEALLALWAGLRGSRQ